MKTKLLIYVLSLGILASFACNGSIQTSEEKEKSDKKSKQGWLGVSIQDMTAKLAKSMDMKVQEGALVTDVTDDSPADSAGMKDEDVIVEFNGKKIENSNALIDAVRNAAPGTKAKIVVMRKDEKKSLTATLSKAPKSKSYSYSYSMPPVPPIPPPHIEVLTESKSKRLGMMLSELNDQLAEYFEVPEGGVLVEKVEKKSAAEKAGFKAGDVIVKAGKKFVDEVNDIRKALNKSERGDTLQFEVVRKGLRKILNVVVEEGDDESSFDIRIQPDIRLQMPKVFKFKKDGSSRDKDCDLQIWMDDMKGNHNDALKNYLDHYRLNIDLNPNIEKNIQIEIEKLGDELNKEKIKMKVQKDVMKKLGKEMKKQSEEIYKKAIQLRQQYRQDI